MDLLPTVADFLGLPAPLGIDGLSLAGPERHGYVVCGAGDAMRGGVDQCVRSERFKYRRFRSRRGAPLREELYDLRLDPEERVPIPPDSPTHQAIFTKHRSWLDAAF